MDVFFLNYIADVVALFCEDAEQIRAISFKVAQLIRLMSQTNGQTNYLR